MPGDANLACKLAFSKGAEAVWGLPLWLRVALLSSIPSMRRLSLIHAGTSTPEKPTLTGEMGEKQAPSSRSQPKQESG